MLRKNLFYLFLSFFFAIGSHNAYGSELISEQDLQRQIEDLKKTESSEANKISLQNLEETLSLLAQINKQNSDNEVLEKTIKDSKQALAKSKANIEKLKSATIPSLEDLAKKSVMELQKELNTLQEESAQIQQKLAVINENSVTQNTALDRTQSALASIASRKQEINSQLTTDIDNTLRLKLTTELSLLDARNNYNQTLLKGNDDLSALYNSQLEENRLVQQNMQARIVDLQSTINARIVEESRNKVEQAKEQVKQSKENESNPIISSQLGINTFISQELLKNTTNMSQLSQDNLRIKNVLDNLQQTQRNIDEQISSLQGTLVLSRIINKQKLALPKDEMIKGLGKKIADLRVSIFDVSEFRDSLSDIPAYINKLEIDEKTNFNDNERKQLTELLTERGNMLAELSKSLTNQLNLAINIELNQQQVQTISDTLQQKLQQQSFWVKSSNEIDLDWFSNLIPTGRYQLRNLAKKFDFSNWKDNLWSASFYITALLLLTLLINNRKENIRQRLREINNSLKTVTSDNQWNTPLAIFWTLILCLPSTFLFLAGFIFVTYICFQDPAEVWGWGLKMAGYWLFFAFLIAMLRPNGIAYRHFHLPEESNERFRNMLKRSVWIIALLLNITIFTNSEMGFSYDVVGQVMTIVVLLITLAFIAPRFIEAVATYQHVVEEQENRQNFLLTMVKIVLMLAPIILIGLIAIGYYYTALVIIEHLVDTYFAVITWIILRNVFYRAFNVSARRLAYRRLQERREQALAKAEQSGTTAEELPFELRDDSMAVSEIKDQTMKITDLLLWFGLFAMLYWVWSDLVTVAYYLEGITLWQQATTTEQGVVMESITLFNLLIAFAVLAVTYILVRNLSGLLETLIFSKLNLSQGTPYTITTLLTYVLVVFGISLAFAMLGMSWNKLQWLFTALSVGLGFGMQEIFGNFVSGIIILFERPVRVGDLITIGSYSGTVSKIRIRATTLIDFDKKEVIVPNKAFITERIVNWALTNSMTRLVINVGVAYGSDLELVKKLLLQVANENKCVLKDPAPVVYFLSFGASTLDHELRVYVGQISERTSTIDALNRRINEIFNENGIEIAFNQLDVFIKNSNTDDEIQISSEKFQNKV